MDSFGFFWILLDSFGFFWILLDSFVSAGCLCRLSLHAVSAGCLCRLSLQDVSAVESFGILFRAAWLSWDSSSSYLLNSSLGILAPRVLRVSRALLNSNIYYCTCANEGRSRIVAAPIKLLKNSMFLMNFVQPHKEKIY